MKPENAAIDFSLFAPPFEVIFKIKIISGIVLFLRGLRLSIS